MQKLLLASVIALLAAPSGVADEVILGVPDVTCQNPAEWQLHDYGGPSPGNAVFGRRDGNIEECGTTYGYFSDGTDCRALASLGASDPTHPLHPYWGLHCATDHPADFDGHAEYAIGGAFLAAESGDGSTSGSLACLGEVGHHYTYPVVEVTDLVQLDFQFFVVTADYSRVGIGPVDGPDCGDNLAEVCNFEAQPPGEFPEPIGSVVDTVNAVYVSLIENPGTTCNPLDQAVVGYGRVLVPFPPGVDGTYNVFVGQSGIQGHIYAHPGGPAEEEGDLPYVCPGHGAYSNG